MKYVVIFLSVLTFACQPRRVIESSGGGSTVSDVQINVPKGQDLSKFLGPNCSDYKVTQETLQRLSVTDACEAATKLLDGFKLTLKFEQCEPGIKAESSSVTGLLSRNKPKDKVVKGCTYSVLVELGDIDADKMYYSNFNTSSKNLVVKKDAPDQISLKVELLATRNGAALGFPGDGIQTPDTQSTSDLNIDATFPNSSTN